MPFFYLKSEINEKISEEFFCFLFFSVAHMFLKTNSTVRKNGIFDSLWGGIQRCVLRLQRFRVDRFLRPGFAVKMLINTKIAICPKFSFNLCRGRKKEVTTCDFHID